MTLWIKGVYALKTARFHYLAQVFLRRESNSQLNIYFLKSAVNASRYLSGC